MLRIHVAVGAYRKPLRWSLIIQENRLQMLSNNQIIICLQSRTSRADQSILAMFTMTQSSSVSAQSDLKIWGFEYWPLAIYTMRKYQSVIRLHWTVNTHQMYGPTRKFIQTPEDRLSSGLVAWKLGHDTFSRSWTATQTVASRIGYRSSPAID